MSKKPKKLVIFLYKLLDKYFTFLIYKQGITCFTGFFTTKYKLAERLTNELFHVIGELHACQNIELVIITDNVKVIRE